jgi:RHS repeat-associated protein
MSSSQFAGGVGGGKITYGANSAEFTDPVGTVWHKIFATTQGEVELTSDEASCSGCSSQPAQLGYDSDGQLTSFTNRNGVQTTYSYGKKGKFNRPTKIIEAVGRPEQRTTNIDWHATLPRRTTLTYADNVVAYQYDAQGRKTQQTITAGAASRTTTYTYNAQGLLSQVNGPRTDVSDTTSYTYDTLGNLTTVTNARGQITTYSQYNGLGQPQRIDYPNGTARTYTYDALGRVLTDTYAGNTTTYTYDANGNKATETTSDGTSTTYLYDASQRLTGINNNLGEQIRYTLDATHKKRPNVTRTDVFDSTGLLVSTSSTVYDGMGRVKQNIDSQGRVTRYSYDGNGNVTQTNDPLNNVVQMNYDGLNRPVLITDPLQHTIQMSYDAADRLTRLTDPDGNATQYTYSGFGDNTQVTSPDTGVTSYTFDAAANTLTKLDARGKTTTYSYDALNRLTQVTFADGQGVTRTYDVAPNGVGQLSSMTDPAGTTSFTYNANGLLLTKTQVSQGVTLQLTYGRDSLGRITSMTYPSGKVLALTYTNDRVTAMAWNGATVISAVQYFPFGAPESWLFGGTTEYTRYIDQNNRIWKYLTPTGSRTLSYDLLGRITQVTDAPSALTQTFTYDTTGRLLTFSGYTSALSSETRGYTYDNNGNRLSANVNGAPSTYVYATGTNKLQSVSGLYTNTYDAAGNLLSDSRLTHTYDARGRLVQTVVSGTGGTTLTFQYNGKGERVTKWDSAANTGRMWMYDEAGNVLGEYAYPGGAVIQELMWLGSAPIAVAGAMPVNYGIGYIWSDHLDTPRAITNGSGQRVWQWDSAPFGETPANGNPSGLGSLAFNLRLPGQLLDLTTGLYHNGYRVYDSAIGRYIQSDPLGLTGGYNTYAYGRANPTKYVDPQGLAGCAPAQNSCPPGDQACCLGKCHDQLLADQANCDRNYRDPATWARCRQIAVVTQERCVFNCT